MWKTSVSSTLLISLWNGGYLLFVGFILRYPVVNLTLSLVKYVLDQKIMDQRDVLQFKRTLRGYEKII
jgi:hypothetical protein